jgi:single-strand DNA-binding protein
MNIAILKGNCGQDPKITNFDNGGKTAQFSLATTKPGYTKQDGTKVEPRTQWHNIVVKKAGLVGVCEQYVKKGTPVLVRGEIETRDYQDSNGQTRYITEIIVEYLDVLNGKKPEQAPAPQPETGDAPF